MKTIHLCFALLLLFNPIFGQQGTQAETQINLTPTRETITEINTEKQISLWIERVLYPYVGKTVVLVDLKLKYPAVKPFGSTYDKPSSLPGLPVSKSKGIKADKVGDEVILPTRVMKKDISIFVNKNVSKKDMNFVSKNIRNWFNLDEAQGDRLEIHRSEKAFLTNELSTKSDIKNNIVYLAVGIVLILLLTVNIKNGFQYLSRTIAVTNKQKSEIVRRGGGYNQLQPISPAAKNMNISNKKPLPITIIENNSNSNGHDFLNFDFVEEISPKQLAHLLVNEPFETLALVLPRLPVSYSSEFFNQKSADLTKIIERILNPSTEHLTSLPALKKDLKKKISIIKDENLLNVDGVDTLSKIINSTSPETAVKIFHHIGKVNRAKQEQIKRRIFLLEDIENLDDHIVEKLIRGVDHDLLVKFLASVNENLQRKFYKNMTQRAVAIIQEDIEIYGDISQQDKSEAQKQILSIFREALTTKRELQ